MSQRRRYWGLLKGLAEKSGRSQQDWHGEMKNYLDQWSGGECSSTADQPDNWEYWPRLIGKVRAELRARRVFVPAQAKPAPGNKVVEIGLGALTDEQVGMIASLRRHLALNNEEAFERWHQRRFKVPAPVNVRQGWKTIGALTHWLTRQHDDVDFREGAIDARRLAQYIFDNYTLAHNEQVVVLAAKNSKRLRTNQLLALLEISKAQRRRQA